MYGRSGRDRGAASIAARQRAVQHRETSVVRLLGVLSRPYVVTFRLM